jgi:hypothetical protein
VRELSVVEPEQLFELVQTSFPAHWIALRTVFPDEGRFDLVLAIAEATTQAGTAAVSAAVLSTMMKAHPDGTEEKFRRRAEYFGAARPR